MAGGPIYLRSLEKVGMADVVNRIGIYNKNVGAISDWIPLEANEIASANGIVDSAVNNELQPLITHGSTRIKSRAHYWAVEDDDPETDTEIWRDGYGVGAHFYEMEGLFDAVTYIEGRSPSPLIRQDENGDQIVEVVIYEKRSRDLWHGEEMTDLKVGDIIHASSVSRNAGLVKGEIVGIFVANNLVDEFWGGSPRSILEPQPPNAYPGREVPLILFTDQDTIAAGVGPSNAGLPMNYIRILFTDPDLIADAKAAVFVDAFEEFDQMIRAELPRGTALLGAQAETRRMDQKMLFLRLPALLLAALALAVVGYYLFLVAGLTARRRELETVMLRSRGLSTFQMLRIQIIESATAVSLPALVAPLIAYFAIGYSGRLPVFESITHGQNLPVEMLPMAWVWAAAAAIVAFLVVLLPTLLIARSSISNADRSRARPDRPPVFQRLYFDLLIVILGGFFLWEMTNRGVASANREGEIVTDPMLLFFAPAMLLISAALVMLRAFPIITRATSWAAVKFTAAPLALGFWRLGRNPYWYAWPVLLIILGTGLGVMVGTLGSTLERSNREQIFYDNGTNLRLRPAGTRNDVRQIEIDELSAIDGVNVATMAYRQKAKVGTTAQGMEFTVLGVEADKFPDMTWFREDFADESLDEIFDRVNVPSKPEPVILPVGTRTLSAWTMQDPYVQDHFFWIVLKDSEERQITVTLGQIGDSWAKHSNDIPEHLVPPIEVTSLQTFMQAGGDGGERTTWFMDDLKASGPGFETTLLDFDGNSLWTALPTSNGLDDSYTDVAEPAGVGDPGTGVGQMTLNRGTVAGVRGAYRSSTGDPVPVIVSENFVALTGIGPGQPLVVQIAGGFVPVLPVAVAGLFPTLDPDRSPFMVLDVKTLLAFVELRGMVYIDANEVFLDIDASRHEQIAASVRQIFRSGSLLDREARIADSVIDPLAVAGWRGMGGVSLIIGGIALVLGYVTYLVAHSNRNIHDSAYLRAMGFSKPGFMRSAAIEHGIVAVLGVVVGVVAGLVTSRLAVGAIAYSETGRALLPPFILQTSWWPVLAILVIAGVAGFIGIASSFIGFLRKPLHELTRTTE